MSQYSRPLDLDNIDNPHTLAILCVPPGSTVLDLGIASGEPVARELQAQSCRVFGVDIDEDAVQLAARYCEEVRVADLDEPDALASWLNSFDVVLALDILEHLRRPADVLKRAATLLSTDGFICVSIPNVTHYSVRQQLLQGRFEYTDDGLLDKTHLRFFDWPAVVALFQDAGVEMHDVYRIQRPLDPDANEQVSPQLAEAFMGDVEAETFQYFVIGRLGPRPVGGGRGVLARLQERFLAQRSVLREAQRYARHLESVLAEREAEVSALRECREHARHLESVLAEREAEVSALRECREHARHLESVLAERETELDDRMRALSLLHAQLAMLRKDLEIKDEFLRWSSRHAGGDERGLGPARTPLEVLGYQFPPDVGKTNVIGYRVVDRVARRIRKLPGYSRVRRLAPPTFE